MSAGMAISYIAQKRFDEAIPWGEKALVQNPRSACLCERWRWRLPTPVVEIRTAADGVRREKAALSSGCEAHPAIRSSRKRSEQSWR